MISLGFCFWKCLWPLFLTHTFSGYSVLAWQFCLFIFWRNGHQILLTAFPDSVVPAKMSAVDLLGEAVIVEYLFHTAVFEIFLFVFAYQHLYSDVSGCASLCIYYTWSSLSLWDMCNLIFFIKLGKNSAIISSNILYLSPVLCAVLLKICWWAK